jgi:tRNA (cmo5U34)-methyltransferase
MHTLNQNKTQEVNCVVIKNIDRFKGKTGLEYELFKLACPHYDGVQNSVKKAIEKYCKKYPKNNILKVLEIGPGDGETTKRILDADPRTQIISVEKNKTMIEKAKINLSISQNSRVEFIHSDILDFLKKYGISQSNYFIPKFDIIASAWTLHNLFESQRDQIYSQLPHFLSVNGLFVNADKYAHDDQTQHTNALYWQIKQFSDVYLNQDVNRPDLYGEWLLHYLQDNEKDRIMHLQNSINKLQSIQPQAKVSCTFREKMEATIEVEFHNPVQILCSF